MLNVVIAECNCAECHYAECRYAKCRGAYLSSSLKLTGQEFSIIDNLGQTQQSFFTVQTPLGLAPALPENIRLGWK
jgi:hypothetical protein